MELLDLMNGLVTFTFALCVVMFALMAVSNMFTDHEANKPEDNDND